MARGAPPEDVFAAVTEEIGQLLPVDSAGMARLEPDGTLAFIEAHTEAALQPSLPLW